MKPIKILFVASIILALGAIIYSCQKEESQSPFAPAGSPMLKAEYNGTDCNAACLQDGPFYQVTESFIRQWGPLIHCDNFRNNKWFNATAWNDMENFYIRVETFGEQCTQIKDKNLGWQCDCPNDANYPFTDVLITLNGVDYIYSMDDPSTPDIIETAVSFEQSFPLPTDWEKCDVMTYSVRLEGDGQPVWLGTPSNEESVTYNLIDECSCATSFIATTQCNQDGLIYGVQCGGNNYNCNHVASFSYTSNSAGYLVITGTLVDTVELVSLCGDLPVITSLQDPSNTFWSVTFEGNIIACDEISVSALWNSNRFSPTITGTWTATLYEDSPTGVILLNSTLDSLTCY